MASAVLLVVLACTAATPPAPPGPAGWVDAVAGDPGVLAALAEADGDGWVRLHRGSIPSGTVDPPGLRALAEEARVESALDAVSAVAWPRLVAAWTARGSLPEDSALLEVAALAAAGEPGEAPARFQGCVAHHAAAATLADAVPCADPLVHEADGTRRFPDPLVHRTRARIAGARSAPLSGLESVVFSGAWSEVDLSPEGEILLDGPGASRFGADLRPPSSDDPDAAIDAAARLDAGLRGWRARHEGAPGAADVFELSLLEQYRSGLLTAAARARLSAGQPRAAAVLLQRARDLDDPRDVGPVNRAELFALSAWAALEAGRSREALDALLPLRADRPHVAGLISVIEDLAVLEGMRRSADSRER